MIFFYRTFLNLIKSVTSDNNKRSTLTQIEIFVSRFIGAKKSDFNLS